MRGETGNSPTPLVRKLAPVPASVLITALTVRRSRPARRKKPSTRTRPDLPRRPPAVGSGSRKRPSSSPHRPVGPLRCRARRARAAAALSAGRCWPGRELELVSFNRRRLAHCRARARARAWRHSRRRRRRRPRTTTGRKRGPGTVVQKAGPDVPKPRVPAEELSVDGNGDGAARPTTGAPFFFFPRTGESDRTTSHRVTARARG